MNSWSGGAIVAVFVGLLGCDSGGGATDGPATSGSAADSTMAGGSSSTDAGREPPDDGSGQPTETPRENSAGGSANQDGPSAADLDGVDSGEGGSSEGSTGNTGDTGGDASAGDEEAPWWADHPVDREPYQQEEQDFCPGENPCVLGECDGDTSPCAADEPLVPLVIDTAEKLATIADCTSFKGTLTFAGAALTSLEGLSLLTIDGDLRIAVDALETLSGLESLVSVSGSVTLGSEDSQLLLTDLSGLSGLRYVGNMLFIHQTPLLESLNGLDAELIRDLRISNAEEFHDASAVSSSCIDGLSLVNLPRLATLEQFPIQPDMRFVLLRELPTIASLAGFEELARVGDTFRIVDLPALEDVSALAGLRAVGDLELEDVPQISDFATFESLEFIGGLTVGGAGPTSLEGLGRLLLLVELRLSDTHAGITDYTGVNSLRELGTLDTTKGVGLEGLQAVEYIGIFTTDGAASLAPLSSLRWLGSFSFRGPAPLPELPPSLELIEGLTIAQTSSTDLGVFDSVATVEGLSLGSGNQLERLDGLHHDGSFERDLRLDGCLDLDLTALSGLSSVSTLSVSRSQLSTLSGLESLRSITGYLNIDETELRDLDGLSALTTVGGSVHIEGNALLRSVEGLSRLRAFGSTETEPELSIANNPVLPQCQVDEIYERFGLDAEGLLNDEEATCD